MKNHTQQTTNTAPVTDKVECPPCDLPCDLPPFCRNHYYTGKLLTARDLQDEQRYAMDKLRLHHLALHGWGVVCGLKVEPHPHCPQLKLVITPGLAIDSCGREVRITEPWEVELPQVAPLPEPEPPCPPEQEEEDSPLDWDSEPEPQRRAAQVPPKARQQTAPAKNRQNEEGPGECATSYTLYVCLRYSECKSEFQHAPFDDCACNQNGQQPNRICESFKLEVLTEKPPGFDRDDECGVDDCRSLYDEMLEPCPQSQPRDCLLLAVIEGYVSGEPVQPDMIDNLTHRQLLPSVSLLGRLIHCILDKLPTHRLTHIESVSWTHRAKYHCHDFMSYFVGNENSPQYFEVAFENPVRGEGITPRTFQAVAVRYSDREGGAGIPAVVPARVKLTDDRYRARLYIDPDYARRYLDHRDFDLYLRLRCDLIVDDNGLAVDGNLVARLDPDGKYVDGPPTGDGIPGGLFESWIRVRTSIKEPAGAY